MPTDLAALLAETGAVAADGLEQARARQRASGGALDTALLELNLLSDEALGPLLARATGLPLAPAGPLEVDVRARRVFPARIAERHGLAPFRLDGRELSILATEPVDRAALEEIGFMLSLDLAVFVAPEWRVRELAARVYGERLAERFAALAARPEAQAPILQPPTGGDDAADALEDLAFSIDEDLTGYTLRPADEAPTLFPVQDPPSGLSPLLASVEPPPASRAHDTLPGMQAPLFGEGDARREPLLEVPAPEAAAPVDGLGAPAEQVQPLDVEHAALTVALEALEPAALLDVPPQLEDAAFDRAGAEVAGAEPGAGEPDRPVTAEEAGAEPGEVGGPEAEPERPVAVAPEPGPDALPEDAPALEPRGAPAEQALSHPAAVLAPAGGADSESEAPPGAARGRRRRRPAPVIIPPLRAAGAGPAAQQEGATLEAATTRDAVVRTALEGANRVFEAAALFAVTHERLTGQDAAGWPGARERTRRAEIPLAQGGILRTAVESRAPYVGPVARESGNVALLASLGRAWPRLAVAYPVLVRGRVVAVLYADHGDADVEPHQLEEVLLAFAGVGAAFDRVLRSAKRLRALSPPMGAAAAEVERRAGEDVAGPPPLSEAALPERGAPAHLEAPSGHAPPAAPSGPPAAPATPPPGRTGPSVDAAPPEIIDLDLSGPETWALLEPGALADLEPQGPVAADPFGLAPAAEVLAAHAVEAPELVRRVCATLPGAAREGLTALLVRRGPEAAAALAAAFPGPLDPRRPGEAAPVSGPVLGALELLGPVATPYLVELLREEDPVRRRRAVEVLGRARDPAAFLPLADRTLDLDPEVAEAARAALAEVRDHPDFPPVIQRLRRALAASPPGAQSKAARALARLAPDAAPPGDGR